MEKYDHKKVEKKWAEKWVRDKSFTPDLEKAKDPYYALFMFPYPSAEGLHIGNFYAFTCVDVMAKYKRLQGKNVFEPIGFDAFGMHSENYALKINETPKKMLSRTMSNFREQLSSAGLGCDWTREIDTTSPEYYKWTQWIFTKLFEKGLAYQKEALLNWCPGCKTVLADEQIEDGVCERCKTAPEKKTMKQWFLKITAYAQRLLDGLDDMDWSDITKHAQKNWIGRSEGAIVKFQIPDSKSQINFKFQIPKYDKILLATTNNSKRKRVKKLLKSVGVNIKVLATEDLKIKKIDVAEDGDLFENAKSKALAYRNKTDLPILGTDSGFYIKDERADPVKVRRNALKGENEKDLSQEQIAKKMFDYYKEIARKNNGQVDAYWKDCFVLSLPDGSIKKSESKREVILTDQISGEIDIYIPIRCLYKPKATGKYVSEQSEDEELKELKPITNSLVQLLCADNNEIKVFTTRPDTLFGATYMVLSPEHPLVNKITAEKQKQEVEKYIKKSGAKSDLERAETKEKTGVFTGAFAVNPVNNEEIPIWIADYVLMGYGTGAIMAVPAHDERDFEFARKFNIEIKEVVKPKIVKYTVIEKSLKNCKKELKKFGDVKVLSYDEDWGDFFEVSIMSENENKFISFLENNLLPEEISGAKSFYADSCGTSNMIVFNRNKFNILNKNNLDKCKKYGHSIGVIDEQIMDLDAKVFTGEGININSDFPVEVKEMNCIMIHGSSGRSKIDDSNYITPDRRHWHGWLADKLNENGYEVKNPIMPQDWEPSYKEWKKEIEKFDINENTILIGTSAGGAFVVKWLGETKKKIKKLILNAPAKISIKGEERIKEFCDFKIDPEIKNRVEKITIFISNDRPHRIKSAHLYAKELDAKLIELKNRKHFCVSDNPINKGFPELLEEILKEEYFTAEADNSDSISLNGLETKEAKEKIIEWLEKNKVGEKTINYKLRDWCISRQRYWGPPVPIVYCEKCGVQAVFEKDLPVKLPEMEKGWEPVGDGRGPLAKVKNFMKTTCPKCGGPAEREPDVMDNFLDSAWYFFRYISPHDSKNIFDKKLSKKWLPVDFYVGGNEHAVLHLMYTRFVTMALHDFGLINFDNPFKKFRANGMILKDGKKMSKSKGNVVNPEEYGEKIGYDALKTYLLFLGPLSEDKSFSDLGAQGAKRWIERIARLEEKMDSNYNDSADLIKKLHQTIKAVTDDFESQKYNTAIARLMELTNALSAEKNISSQTWKKFLVLIAPFAPALAEEFWQKFGNKKSVFKASWPKYNSELIKDETINLAVQVNGKFRGTIETEINISENEAKKIVLKNEKIRKWIENKKIIKTIFIKGRLVNFIVK